VWRPIGLIALDLDDPIKTLPPEVAPGDRIWIEALRRGRVVGLVETRAEIGGLSETVMDQLRQDFSEVPFSADPRVVDDLLAKATVVVPTICRNPSELVRTVDALLDLDYPEFEIIVVDNRPDGAREPLPSFRGGERVRVCAEFRRGISAARNCGTAVATGDFVAFTDDDVVVDRGWLRALGEGFSRDSEVEGIGGLVLPLELSTAPQLWFEEFYGGFSRSFRAEKSNLKLGRPSDPLFPYAPGRFGAGCNMAFRRSTLQRMGGFNTSLGTGTPARGGEDLALFFDLLMSGGTIAFEPAALVRHSHRRTEREFMSQVFGYGIGLTAMYTAMIVQNPRHLWALIRRVRAGVRLLTRARDERSPSRAPSYPRRTLGYQLLGMALGVFAYARSAVRARRYS